MSLPNPPNPRRRRARRYFSESGEARVWFELFVECLTVSGDKFTGSMIYVEDAAKAADRALIEYRRRYPEPVREVDESPADDEETAQGGPVQ